ncbi:hypothetical protein NMY22_g6963 [Coprinellus aureogranulatus]|nr:hypothetical protein NMY22_g6963 [Coprinellus aureogranulatus]
MQCLVNLILTLLTVFTATADAYAIPFRRIHITGSSGLIHPALKISARDESATLPLEPSGFVIPITLPVQTSTRTSQPPSTLTSSQQQTQTITSSSQSTPTSTSSQAPTQTPTSDDGRRKLVVAHHMVGNTFSYTKQTWLDDIVLAHESGIDGFALNTGRDPWEPARIADAYAAAEESKLDFKLFLSLDMTSLPCSSPDHAAFVRKLVLDHASHPNQLKYNDNQAFVSTFAGELCNFGLGGGAEEVWKNAFTQHPDVKGKVYFVPSFFIDPATFGKFNGVMDGDFNWNSGWPIKVTTNFAKDVLNGITSRLSDAVRTGLGINNKPLNQIFSAASATPASVSDAQKGLEELQNALSKFIGSIESDNEHLTGLKSLAPSIGKRDGEENRPVYMAAVSPWFYTHYGPNSFNKNWIFLADQHLYVKRWESIVESRLQVDIIQILSWNDFGESHYIGPLTNDQPKDTTWTTGMNHTAWLGMTKYYAEVFKTGEYPKIEKDRIYLWSRPHPANAKASEDPLAPPDNFELTEDAVWAVVFATAPSKVTLSTGDSAENQKTFDVPAGVSKLSVPITPGGTMKGTVERDGKVIVEVAPTPEEFTFQGAPKTYNYNVFVVGKEAE